MQDIIIASQLPEAVGAVFASLAPGSRFQAIPHGTVKDMPDGARILMVLPFPDNEAALTVPPPPGWPFDLKWFHLLSVGLDLYPRWLLDAPLVTHSPGVMAVGLAEFAIAAIFAQAKRLPEAWMPEWDDGQHKMLDTVAGGKVGIVGFGAIGEAIAVRAQAMGMTVQALRRSEQPLLAGVQRAKNIAELFATSDHVVLALPATGETQGMIDAQVLTSAKPGLHLVNIARGSLVDHRALLAALESGRIARATLDVTHPQPLPAAHTLRSHPGVKISEHVASVTPAVLRGLANVFAENFERYRAGAPLRNLVNRARGY